jgi:hypothetical protein
MARTREAAQGRARAAREVEVVREAPPRAAGLLVMQRVIGNQAVARQARRARSASLPDGLRAGLERLSGISLAGVRVRHDSPEPRRHQALAFTRGDEIHLGPGQERHLGHEAWHAVQQRQGRVRATTTVGGVAVNDDRALEREADELGAAAGRGGHVPKGMSGAAGGAGPAGGVVQRILAAKNADDEWVSELNPGAPIGAGEGYIRVTSFTQAADAKLGSVSTRDHAYVGVEYVDAGGPKTTFTDLTDKGIRYFDDSSASLYGQDVDDPDGQQMRSILPDKLCGKKVLGTTYKVSAGQAIAACDRAKEISGEYFGANPKADQDPKYKFSRRGRALGTDHYMNCARFAQKVLKAAGIAADSGVIAKTPFEVANQNDASKGLKLIDATDPDLDVKDVTKDLAALTKGNGDLGKVQSRMAAHIGKSLNFGGPNLTDTDVEAIDDWVAGSWSAMNRYVRGLMKPDEKLAAEQKTYKNMKELPTMPQRVTNLNAVLDKLPAFEGKSYRIASAKDEDVYGKVIRPGDYLTDKGFTASSKVKGGEGGASGWGEKGKVFFEIKGSSGRLISPYSRMPGEREVLFKQGVVFKVDAIKIEDGATYVVVSEVDPPQGAVLKSAFDGGEVTLP